MTFVFFFKLIKVYNTNTTLHTNIEQNNLALGRSILHLPHNLFKDEINFTTFLNRRIPPSTSWGKDNNTTFEHFPNIANKRNIVVVTMLIECNLKPLFHQSSRTAWRCCLATKTMTAPIGLEEEAKNTTMLLLAERPSRGTRAKTLITAVPGPCTRASVSTSGGRRTALVLTWIDQYLASELAVG